MSTHLFCHATTQQRCMGVLPGCHDHFEAGSLQQTTRLDGRARYCHQPSRTWSLICPGDLDSFVEEQSNIPGLGDHFGLAA